MRYELVEHTADVAVRIRGADLAEVAQNLVFTVCDQLADASLVKPTTSAALAVTGVDREALLVALANDLIYRRDADGMLFATLDVEEITPTQLRGRLHGEPAAATHDLRAGLKAATWHELAVTDDEHGLTLFMVFDV